MNHGATAKGQTLCPDCNYVDETRQPFASPVNVIDSIVITEELDPTAILAEWIAYDPSISVYSDLQATHAVKMFVYWSDQNGTIDLMQGDYFTFVIPDIFNYDYITNVDDVPITTSAGEVVATYSIYDNANNMKEVRITFTDYVENHTNISGDFWDLLFVGNVAETEQRTLEFIVNNSAVAQGVVTINPTETFTPTNHKVGFSLPERSESGYYVFEWIVYINMGENAVHGFNRLEGFSFEDIIPADSPHIFLSDRIRGELNIPSDEYATAIGEYVGADAYPPSNRYPRFFYQYNSTGSEIWYNDINWHTLVNGLTTVGIDGTDGLNVSEIEVGDKIFSAQLGTVTRPTAIRFYTISTIQLTESALGDVEVVGLFENIFRGSYGEDLNASLTLYRFEAGGSAQGISGDYNFTFTKVNAAGEGIPGAMFALYTSQDFAAGADRFVFSGDDGIVAFNNLPTGTYYVLESRSPYGYLPNSTVYRVVLTTQGYDIYYGPNFEYRLVDNRIEDTSEFEVLPAIVLLAGRKNLTGAALEEGQFSFVVKNVAGDTVATGFNREDGSIQFSSIEFREAGVFTFTIEEVMGDDSDIIYDGNIFTVTVTVTDDGTGNLSAEVSYPEEGIEFNNRVEATFVLVMLEGTKNLTGRTLEAGMFQFNVKDNMGRVVSTGTNTADGRIQFSNIRFDAPGVYTFTVEEVRGTDSGIIYDESIFTVIVTVTAGADETLVAEVSYPVGGIVFNNRSVVPPEKPCHCRCRCYCRTSCRPVNRSCMCQHCNRFRNSRF